MWLHLDPNQALSLAVRFCAVAQLVGLLELALVRRELGHSGFLDWTMIGNLSPRTRTRAGSAIRRTFRRLGARPFAGLVVADAVLATALLVWPSQVAVIACAAALQVLLLKRHHMTIDGSDQMSLVVLVACLLGRIGGDAISVRAAVSFIAAELTLAYVLAGISKATSSYWRSGSALPIIVQTRMYGQPAVARLLGTRPAVGRAAGHSVLAWESLFLIALTAPPTVVLAILAAGIAFHAGCAIVMGLNRFLWAFAAAYPALLCTNAAIRHEIGSSTANAITIAALALGMVALVAGGATRATLSPGQRTAEARVTRS
jgi:hypothetical protein